MLAITPAPTNLKKTTPNVLPCAIKHDGPVSASRRYWSPSEQPPKGAAGDRTSTAYYRGRKLRGRHVQVPEAYQGVVLEKTGKVMPVPKKVITAEELRRMEEEVYGDDEMDGAGFDDSREKAVEVDVKMMEPVAEFEEIIVWGHELMPEDDDIYVQAMQEYIAFAEAMHNAENDESTPPNTT